MTGPRSAHRPGRPLWVGFLFLIQFLGVGNALAQEPAPAPATNAPTAAQEAIPAPQGAPVGLLPNRPLTLADCLHMGLAHQPSLAAARASVAAAAAQRHALYNLPRLANLAAHDLPVRRQQAGLGVAVAEAGVCQAEWDTAYAITRNYFSVQYARRQERLARDLVKKIDIYREKAAYLVTQPLPDSKVTTIDVQKLEVYGEYLQTKVIQAAQGSERALAALREAMGLEPCCLLLVEEDLPALMEVPCVADLVALAQARRGEVIQAGLASQVFWLEVDAQGRVRQTVARTFAAGTDVHARPIPTPIYNDIYRPGAVGPEAPTTLVGRREDRVARARELAVRSGAVAAKARQLVALEVEDAYHRWKEAALKLRALEQTPAKTRKLLESTELRFNTSGEVSGEEMLRTKLLNDQIQADLNEALYRHALALAALERVTAGGFVPCYRQNFTPAVAATGDAAGPGEPAAALP